jgi:MYXO-CTERM domain-containing protein
MGERGQAVKTDDSVDEARNRRATYILSPQPQKPSGASMPNPGAWKLLSGESPRMMMSLPALPQSYLDYKEKQREEREKKFGKGSGTASSGAGGTDSDAGASGAGSGSSGADTGTDAPSGGGEPYLGGAGGDGGGAGGPPETEAGKKGCSVAASSDLTADLGGLAFGLVVLGALAHRRRRG